MTPYIGPLDDAQITAFRADATVGSLTDAQKRVLDALLADWQDDSSGKTYSYGWAGPTDTEDFLDFWFEGAGGEELDDLCAGNAELRTQAWQHLYSRVR